MVHSNGIAAARLGLANVGYKSNARLPAFVFTLAGLVFVLYGLRGSRAFPLCVGVFSLGIAAAIRGAMLPAGLSILGFWYWKHPRGSALVIASALVSFAIPIALDDAFQHIFHTMNNAPVALYCAATDPTHFWTPECQLRFQRRAITDAQTLEIYLRFILFTQSLMDFTTGLGERIRYDLSSLGGPPFFGTLLLALAYRLRSMSENSSDFPAVPWIKRAKADLVVICSLLFLNIPLIDLALLIALCCFVALRRDFISLVCLSVYVSGLFMMTLFGATLVNGINTDRAISTFSFALPLGLLVAVMAVDTDRSFFALKIPKIFRQIPSAISGFAFVALYLGVWFLPFSWRSRYFSEDHTNNVALKIFDDPAVDRSGYYLLRKTIYGTMRPYPVYTVRDDFAIGTTRRFESLATDAVENETFRRPNRINSVIEIPSAAYKKHWMERFWNRGCCTLDMAIYIVNLICKLRLCDASEFPVSHSKIKVEISFAFIRGGHCVAVGYSNRCRSIIRNLMAVGKLTKVQKNCQSSLIFQTYQNGRWLWHKAYNRKNTEDALDHKARLFADKNVQARLPVSTDQSAFPSAADLLRG